MRKKLEENALVFSMLEKKSGRFIGNIEFMDALKDYALNCSFEGFLDILSLRKSSQPHATSFYLHNGAILDLNRRSAIIDRVFDLSTNNLVKAYKPHYFVDLHESIGKECFLYVRRNDAKAISIAERVIDDLMNNRVPVRYSATDREVLSRGIFALESFADYAPCSSEYPIEIIFETGIDSSIDNRLSWIALFMNSIFQLVHGLKS